MQFVSLSSFSSFSSFSLSLLGRARVNREHLPHFVIALQQPATRGKITFMDLLTTVLIIEAGMCLTYLAVRAHCWLIFNLLSTWIPDFFPQNCFIDNWPPAYTVAWGGSTQDEKLCMYFYWSSRGFCQLTAPACPGPSEEQPCPPANWLLLLVWHCPQTCWKCTSFHMPIAELQSRKL